jgi:small conductance mechanosensitive channel
MSEQASSIESQIASYLGEYGFRILIAVIFLIIAFKIIGKITKRTATKLQKRKVDPAQEHIVVLIVKFGLYFIALLIAALMLGLSASSVFIMFILIIIFLILTLQSSIANIGAGVLLFILKPFSVGEYIKIHGQEGTVLKISLYHTVLLNIDNTVVYVPNVEALKSDIVNTEKKRKRQVEINIMVAPSSDFTALRKSALQTVQKDRRILKDPKPEIVVFSISDEGVVVQTRLWVKPDDYWQVLFEYNEKILLAFTKLGVDFIPRRLGQPLQDTLKK